MPTEIVPQIPARPCAERAPTGSSRYFSIVSTPKTTIAPATEADHGSRPELDVAGWSRDSHEPRDRAVAGHADIERAGLEPADEHRPEHAGRGRELGVQRDLGEDTAAGGQRRTGVEPEPADPEDHHPEADDRHRVTGDRPWLAVSAVLALAGAEQQQCRQGPPLHRSGGRPTSRRSQGLPCRRCRQAVRCPTRTRERPAGR